MYVVCIDVSAVISCIALLGVYVSMYVYTYKIAKVYEDMYVCSCSLMATFINDLFVFLLYWTQ